MKAEVLSSILVLGLIISLSITNPIYSKPISLNETDVSPAKIKLDSLDSDQDGYSDLSEKLHKTDPNNAESKPSSDVTINVPLDVKTIQEAIDAAIDKDTILVAQGKYKGNIYFKGKSITLTSTDPDNPDVVANSIIEGTEPGSVITLDSNSVLKGFTITSKNVDCRGIYIGNVSPTIENCTIIDNETTALGGGIFITDNSRPQITNCIITGNADSTGTTGISTQIFGGTPQITQTYIEGPGFVDTNETTPIPPTAEIPDTEEVFHKTLPPRPIRPTVEESNPLSKSRVTTTEPTTLTINTGSLAGKLFAGGSNPASVYKYLGAFGWEKISTGSALESEFAVLCLCGYNGELYAGTRAYSDGVGKIWKYDWDNTTWTLVGDNLDEQVSALVVYQGKLHAGTSWRDEDENAVAGKLYRYDYESYPPTVAWTNVVDTYERIGLPSDSPILEWVGFRSLYVWDKFGSILYIGDLGLDRFGHYDGMNFREDQDEGNSCIWDHEGYNDKLYASAYNGYIYESYDGTNWTLIRSGGGNSWELETFRNFLYASNGGSLYRYDGISWSYDIWGTPDYTDIISMIGTGDLLVFGTGYEAGYGAGRDMENIGKIYTYDGTYDPELISIGMSGGIQTLLLLSEEQSSIEGYIWNDLNADGIWDERELGEQARSFIVYIDSNDNGNLDPGEYQTSIDDIDPDNRGYYTFTGLTGGTYIVRQTGVEDYVSQTFPPNNGPQIVTLGEDETVSNRNFGVRGKRIRYVDDSAPANGDGISWNTAFKYLQDALNDPSIREYAEILVAQGTYKPDQGGDTPLDRTATFQLINGVRVRGGYAGAYADIEDPYACDIETYQTILSGDLAGNDLIPDLINYEENSYHVVTSSNIDGLAETIIDGFIIEGGYGNEPISAPYDPYEISQQAGGGGMRNYLSSPIIQNCTFRYNNAERSGGAISNLSSSPQIINCTFIGNKVKRAEGTGGSGAAIYSKSSHLQIEDCTFTDNYAYFAGGAIYATESYSEITNCMFVNNWSQYGGAINNQYSPSITITNCVFSENSGYYGGGLYNFSSALVAINSTFNKNIARGTAGGIIHGGDEEYSSATLINCILWGNTHSATGNAEVKSSSSVNPIHISYCDIKDSGGSANWDASIGIDDGDNIDAEPLFVDVNNPTGHGLKLTYNSPCIDVANDSSAPLTDILGKERIIADMGAYDRGFPITLYVDDDALEGGNGTSWNIAFKYLQDALAVASDGDKVLVAQGTYKPDQSETPGLIPINSREATFQLINGITLEGGYAGLDYVELGILSPDDRNIETYQTILSGDLAGNDLTPDFVNYEENSYHVITCTNTDAATINGFIIEGGYANESISAPYDPYEISQQAGGGGIRNFSSSPIIQNCTFRYNNAERSGGAISNLSSSPKILNCTFIENKVKRAEGTGGSGAAIYNQSSSSQIKNCTFADNYAYVRGGAVHATTSQSEITNCIFSNNWSQYGGAIDNQSGSSMTVTNCVFAGNSGYDGGGLSNWHSSVVVTNSTFNKNIARYRGGAVFNLGSEEYSSATLRNCILWDNTDRYSGNDEVKSAFNTNPVHISHCDIKGSSNSWGDDYFGIDDGDNIDTDPSFCDVDNPLGHGLRLKTGSPCTDTADDLAAPLTDILEQGRIDIPNVGFAIADMGAYEQTLTYQTAVVKGGQIYISTDDGETWVPKEYDRNWSSIAISCDGSRQTAVVENGEIYVSNNYGENWYTKATGNQEWSGVAMSSDGLYQTAIVYGGQIYVSTNSWEDWSIVGSTGLFDLQGLAMSSDGSHQTAVAYRSAIYVSTDYGANWDAKVGTQDQGWSGVAMSSDGLYQTAIAYNIFISADSGENWEYIDVNGTYNNWSGVAMSSTGQYQTAVAYDGQIYVSIDYGNTWNPKEENRSWKGIDMSSTGQNQTAVVYGGQIYISTDYGNTWTAKESNRSWVGIAISD